MQNLVDTPDSVLGDNIYLISFSYYQYISIFS